MRVSRLLSVSLVPVVLLAAAGCKQANNDDGEGEGGGDATSTTATGSTSSSSGGAGGGDGGAGGTSTTDSTSTDATTTDAVTTGDTSTADTSTGATTSTGTGGGGPAGWTIHTHSCSGASRTDALLVEDDGTMWVGCGTNQVGYGLHTSSDGGATWSEVATVPEGDMAQFRVSGIARGDDGLLYAAGFDANDSQMVLSLDTAASPMTATEVLYAGNVVGTSFHVGSFAVLSEGRIFAESLTGYGALFRPDAGTPASGQSWEDAYYWANEGGPPGYQMMDMFELNDTIYGCGATIAEPPYVFLPPRDPGQEVFELEVVELPNDGWTGEMWGVAATEDRVVVVGVDQDGDIGKIYVSGADPYEATDYTETNLTDIPGVGDNNLGTWARGVCMRGERVVVVGERQPLSSNTGLVLLSDDGGATFTNITPEDDVTESVSKCHITESGEVIVAGGGGFIGIYR